MPTIDTIRYNFLVEAFTRKKKPVLLVGPVGTGKTSTVQKALDALDKNKFLLLTVNMSAQTTAHNVQETIEGRLEKRTKDVWVPQASKRLVVSVANAILAILLPLPSPFSKKMNTN